MPPVEANHAPALSLEPEHLKGALEPFLTIDPQVADYTRDKQLTVHVDNGGAGYTLYTDGHTITNAVAGKHGTADAVVMATNDGPYLSLYNAYKPTNTAKLLVKGRYLTFHATDPPAAAALKSLSEGHLDDRLASTPPSDGSQVSHDGENSALVAAGNGTFTLSYPATTYTVNQWGALTGISPSPRIVAIAGKVSDKVTSILEKCDASSADAAADPNCAALSAKPERNGVDFRILATFEETGVRDVAPSYWASKTMLSDVEAGIVKSGSGAPTGTHGSNRNLKGFSDLTSGKSMTRIEVATFIAKALGIEPKQGVTASNVPFRDFHLLDEAEWGLVAALFETGILTTFEDKTFRPYNVLTKAELATIADRILNWEGGA